MLGRERFMIESGHQHRVGPRLYNRNAAGKPIPTDQMEMFRFGRGVGQCEDVSESPTFPKAIARQGLWTGSVAGTFQNCP